MAEVVGGMTGALQGSLTGLVNKGQDWLDWILPPEKRGEIWAKLSKFATEKPLIAVCIATVAFFVFFSQNSSLKEEIRIN